MEYQFVLGAKALSAQHTYIQQSNNLHQSEASSCRQPAELETKEFDWCALKEGPSNHISDLLELLSPNIFIGFYSDGFFFF